jgi:hypothetical protein
MFHIIPYGSPLLHLTLFPVVQNKPEKKQGKKKVTNLLKPSKTGKSVNKRCRRMENKEKPGLRTRRKTKEERMGGKKVNNDKLLFS